MSGKINPDDFSLDQLTTYQVGAMQAAANRALKRHGDELLRDYGITNMQWHIIGAVYDAHPQGARISDLAEMLDTTLAFLTNNVNLLASKNILIRKDNDLDGRSRLVFITPEFLPKCREIELSMRNKLRQSLYAQISPEELHTYIKVIGKFGNL